MQTLRSNTHLEDENAEVLLNRVEFSLEISSEHRSMSRSGFYFLALSSDHTDIVTFS